MKKITISENFIIRRIANSVLLVPMIRELSQDVATYTLNPTAAEIIGYIEKNDGKNNQQILEFMTQSYPDIATKQLQEDIQECIDDLQEIGAVIIENCND